MTAPATLSLIRAMDVGVSCWIVMLASARWRASMLMKLSCGNHELRSCLIALSRLTKR